MRQSDSRLTLQVYADAGVVGIGNAVDAMFKGVQYMVCRVAYGLVQKLAATRGGDG